MGRKTMGIIRNNNNNNNNHNTYTLRLRVHIGASAYQRVTRVVTHVILYEKKPVTTLPSV